MTRSAQLAAAMMVLIGCRFDSTSKLGASIACENDAQCPGGLVCQVTARLCVKPDAFDALAPSVSQSTVSIRPLANNALDTPTAMGPLADAHLSLVISEALTRPPAVTGLAAGSADVRVTCRLESQAAPAFEFTCSTVPSSSGADALLSWQVDLTDVALNAATVLLGQTTKLDLTAPPAPLAVDAGIEVRDSPWGDEQTGRQPSTRIVAQPHVVPEAVSVVFRRGTALLGSAQVDDQGTFAAFEAPRALGDALIEVKSINSAGNESPWEPIHDYLWVATFNNKIAGRLFPNPHRFEVTRAVAEGIEGHDVTERGALDGIAFVDGKTAEVRGAGSWRRVELTRGPEGRAGLPGTAFDPLRSRVVRFGGWESNGTLGGTVWEWSGLDWKPRAASDPEGDGDPAPRYFNAMTWDPKQRGIVMYGGTTDSRLNDTWLWNGTSWKRLPDGPGARTGAMLYFDESQDAVVLYGGVDDQNIALTDAWRLDSDRWARVSAPPIGLRFAPAVCTEPFTATVFVFGGGLSDGSPLWLLSKGQWAPSTVPGGPENRRSTSCAWDSARGVLVVMGGELTDGGIADDVWEFDSVKWVKRTPSAGPTPGPRTQHRLIYDPAREMMLLFGDAIGSNTPETTWKWSGSEWSIAYRPSTAPPVVASNNLVFDPLAGALRAVGYDPALGVGNSYLSNQGWRSELTTAMPLGVTRLVYDSDGQRCLIATGSLAQPTASIWRSETDGGWERLNEDAGFNAGKMFDAAPSASGLDVVIQGPSGQVQLVAISSSTGVPKAPVTLGPGTWAAAAALPSGTAVLRSDIGVRFSPVLSIVENGAQVGNYILPEPMVPNGMVADLERGTLLVPGGTRVGRTSTETWEFTFDGGWSPVPVADPDSDGQPTFVPFPSMGYDTQNGAMVAIEVNSGQPSTTWVFTLARQRPQVVLRFSLLDLPKDLVARDGQLLITGGASGGSVGSKPGFGVSIRAPGWWAPTTLESSATAEAPEQLRVPFLLMGSEYVNAVAARLGEADFLLEPLAPNGTGQARMVIDAVQLELRYRKP